MSLEEPKDRFELENNDNELKDRLIKITQSEEQME